MNTKEMYAAMLKRRREQDIQDFARLRRLAETPTAADRTGYAVEGCHVLSLFAALVLVLLAAAGLSGGPVRGILPLVLLFAVSYALLFGSRFLWRYLVVYPHLSSAEKRRLLHVDTIGRLQELERKIA